MVTVLAPPYRTRAEAGITVPTRPRSLDAPVEYVFLHHSAGTYCHDDAMLGPICRGIDRLAVSQGKGTGGEYSFAVAADGTIQELCGVEWVPAATKDLNRRSWAILLLGNFHGDRPDAVTEAHIDSVAKLFVWLASTKFSAPALTLYGHRDAHALGSSTITACPGDTAYAHLGDIKRRVQKYRSPLPVPALQEETMRLIRPYGYWDTFCMGEGVPPFKIPGDTDAARVTNAQSIVDDGLTRFPPRTPYVQATDVVQSLDVFTMLAGVDPRDPANQFTPSGEP